MTALACAPERLLPSAESPFLEIRRWRAECGVSLAVFARRLDVELSELATWEAGDAFPPDRIVVRLCRETGADLGRLRRRCGLPDHRLPPHRGWRAGELGALLEQNRRRLALSQRAVARELDVCSTVVATWEAGRVPDPRRLPLLAEWLGAPVEAVRRAAGRDQVRRAAWSQPENLTMLGRRRLERGWSQPEVAVRLSVAVSTYSRWEGGERRPPLDLFPSLAEVFSCELDDVHTWFSGYPETSRSGIGKLPGLRDYLEHHDIRTEDLAVALGVEERVLRHWVVGRRAIPAQTVVLLEQLLGIDLHRPSASLRRLSPKKVPSTVGTLAEARARRGLSLAELGRRTGVPPALVSSWERTGRCPGHARLSLLGSALGVPPQALCTCPPLLCGIEWGAVPLQDRIRALRQREGLTGAGLGRCIGVSGATVHRWETGETRPSLRRLELLATILGAELLASAPPAASEPPEHLRAARAGKEAAISEEPSTRGSGLTS